MSEGAYFHNRAVKQAQIHARWLTDNAARLRPEPSLPQAVRLITDYVYNLDQPALAVQLVIQFHPHVERWSQWGTWLPALDAALHASRCASLPLDEIRLLNSRSQAARELGDYEMATADATQALDLAKRHGDRVLMATSLNKLGVIAWNRDQRLVAQHHWVQAYQIGKLILPALEAGQIVMNLGIIASRKGLFAEAQQYYAFAQQHFDDAGDQAMQAKLLCNRGQLYLLQGQLDIAKSLWTQAAEALAHLAMQWDLAMLQNSVGYLYLKQNHYQEAMRYLQTSFEEFAALGSLSGKVWSLSNIIELCVTTKDWGQATYLIEQARELATLCEQPLTIANINIDHGRVLAAQGDYEGAKALWLTSLMVQQEKGATLLAQQTQQLLASLPI